MAILISVLVILVFATASFWWSGSSSDAKIYTNETKSTSTEEKTGTQETQNNLTAPIEMAKEAREALETRSGTTLNLSGKGLTKVPNTIFGQTDLVTLNLSNNKLEGALQAEVRQLRNLRTLNLSHNNFTGVPAEIGQLTKLETLDLSFNKLTGLPHELGNLLNLQKLDLRGNVYSKADLLIIQKNLPNTEILTDS
jgi:Leucine-rich repeat (LRR) protein